MIAIKLDIASVYANLTMKPKNTLYYQLTIMSPVALNTLYFQVVNYEDPARPISLVYSADATMGYFTDTFQYTVEALELKAENTSGIVIITDSEKGDNELGRTYYSAKDFAGQNHTCTTTRNSKQIICGISNYKYDINKPFYAAIQCIKPQRKILTFYPYNTQALGITILGSDPQTCNDCMNNWFVKFTNSKNEEITSVKYICIKKGPIIPDSAIYTMTCTGSTLEIAGYNKGEYTAILVIWGSGKVTLSHIDVGPFSLVLTYKCCGKARATLINNLIYQSLNPVTCYLQPQYLVEQ